MQHWRTRENRKSVRISVRVRTDDGWVDATVRNVSNRGMMLHSLQPLRRNQFVEITRGRHRVVGRIVWSNATVCGLHSRESVDIAGLLAPPTAGASNEREERRARPRGTPQARAIPLGERAAASRALGRTFEFAFVACAASCVAVIATVSVQEALAAPLEEVRLAMAGQAPAIEARP